MSDKATPTQPLTEMSELQLRTMRRHLTQRLNVDLNRKLLDDYQDQLAAIDSELDAREAHLDLTDALDLVRTMDLIRLSTDMMLRAVVATDPAEADECRSMHREMERYLDWRLQPAFAEWLSSDDQCAKATRDLIEHDVTTALLTHRAARLAYQSGRVDAMKETHKSVAFLKGSLELPVPSVAS